MHVLIVINHIIPVEKYGGTERVIWALGRELVKLKHEVTYLAMAGSTCSFANVLIIDPSVTIDQQIPENVDVIHFQFEPPGLDAIKKPYVITMHGNKPAHATLDKNTIFVSKDHAQRFHSDQFVYNGLLWDDYSNPNLDSKRSYFHFLGKARWKVKNLKGACSVIRATSSEKLVVLGGETFHSKNGIKNILHRRIKFAGMVGGTVKDEYLRNSKGLIFPVRWNEPFGLAIIESLYYGNPIFGTPYGSLPELVSSDVGFLSNNKSELSEAIGHSSEYSKKLCHELARDVYNSANMTLAYIDKYEQVLNGNSLSKANIIAQEDYDLLAWLE